MEGSLTDFAPVSEPSDVQRDELLNRPVADSLLAYLNEVRGGKQELDMNNSLIVGALQSLNLESDEQFWRMMDELQDRGILWMTSAVDRILIHFGERPAQIDPESVPAEQPKEVAGDREITIGDFLDSLDQEIAQIDEHIKPYLAKRDLLLQTRSRVQGLLGKN